MISIWLTDVTGYVIFSNRLFRAGAASIVAFILVMVFMPKFIRWLQKQNATSDFDEQKEKKSPPIMGGLLIIVAVIASTLLFSEPNAYAISILAIMIAYTAVGGLDDYLKIRNKKMVLAGKLEKKDYMAKADGLSTSTRLLAYFIFSLLVSLFAYKFIPGLTGHLTVPFIKPEVWHPYLPAPFFIGLMSFVVTSTANGANFTDGLDTLVSIPLITTAMFVGVVAYISANNPAAKYFLIPYLPGIDELLPIASAIVGALIAYLWFNSPPAQIYMGDTGSIGLGGTIGMMFVLINGELFLPIVGFIFVVESLSVVIQIGYFKLTRKFSKDRSPRRVFLRAPIHEHYKIKWAEKYPSPFQRNSKIIWRFHLISILALIIGLLIFFKIR